MNRAVFMDRDGTVIREKNYTTDPKEVKLLPTSASAIKLLKNEGFKILVVTNQSGVGRGYFSLGDLHRVNERILELLKTEGTCVDKVYFCPHSPEDNCECRKPKPGMVNQAKKEFDIDLKQSYVIGDRPEDIELGKRAGLQTILVLTGYGKDVLKLSKPDFEVKGLLKTLDVTEEELLSDYGKSTLRQVNPDFVAKDLLEAANWICKKEN
ncbi:HAD-IIIA family hydrolase [candidate division WOR-3 bacterium]|nr:HAD-IIIA family hydrolase [candidate division WOR-3 bacterium]